MRILYFFRLNPATKSSGSQWKAYTLLQYFKDRKIKVDFISDYTWGQWDDKAITHFKQKELAENLWFIKKKPEKKNLLVYLFSYKIPHFIYKITHPYGRHSFPNHATLRVRRQFFNILKKRPYDYIIISYAYWAHLLKDNPHIGNAKTIIDTHDMLSAQHQHDKRIHIGHALADELKRLDMFDQVWAISYEEAYFFSQFLKNKVKYIPLMIEKPHENEIPAAQRRYDVTYVATDNPHNRTASKWFFDHVYPLLPLSIKIRIVGSIGSCIPENLPNVTCVDYVEDLHLVYKQTKIAICPMLTGTGIKVKIVEALAYGIPVVCNERGLDGLPAKSNNGCLVTNNAATFANYMEQLLEDEPLYHQLSNEGIMLVRENFTKENMYLKLDEAFSYHTNQA